MLSTMFRRNLLDFEDSFIPYFSYDYSYHLDKGLNMKINVPGYGKEDLELNLENNILVLSSKDKKILKKYSLPETLDFDSIKSSCEKGVLTITGSPQINSKNKIIEIK